MNKPLIFGGAILAIGGIIYLVIKKQQLMPAANKTTPANLAISTAPADAPLGLTPSTTAQAAVVPPIGNEPLTKTPKLVQIVPGIDTHAQTPVIVKNLPAKTTLPTITPQVTIVPGINTPAVQTPVIVKNLPAKTTLPTITPQVTVPGIDTPAVQTPVIVKNLPAKTTLPTIIPQVTVPGIDTHGPQYPQNTYTPTIGKTIDQIVYQTPPVDKYSSSIESANELISSAYTTNYENGNNMSQKMFDVFSKYR